MGWGEGGTAHPLEGEEGKRSDHKEPYWLDHVRMSLELACVPTLPSNLHRIQSSTHVVQTAHINMNSISAPQTLLELQELTCPFACAWLRRTTSPPM